MSVHMFVGAAFSALPFGTEALVGGFGNERSIDSFGKGFVLVVP